MATFSLLVILLSVVGVSVTASLSVVGSRHTVEEIKKRNGQLKNVAVDPFSKFFTQRLDHFDRSNNVTFSQRYFVNTTFWDGNANSPVFLCVGGEGTPLDYTVLTDSVHCSDMTELAPKHNALMLALEHRYYGPSNPFSDYSTEHLKWLNSEQAAGDIASFYDVMTDTYKLQATNKWVTWGGSYPGMMAAIARLRYPHLIHATVSSSAPLRAEVDMVGYNNVVADSLAAASAGGSDACLNTVVEGHQTIGKFVVCLSVSLA